MTDDAAVTVSALRRYGLNGTFKTVEHVILVIHANDEALVVVVSAYFTPGHTVLLHSDVLASMCDMQSGFVSTSFVGMARGSQIQS